MKTYIKYIALAMLLAASSCRDEEKSPFPDFIRTSVPVFLQKENDTGFIDYMDLNRSMVTFDVDKLGSEDVSSIDVFLTFNNSQTGKAETIMYTTVTSLPQNVSLTFAELIDQFPDEVLTVDTLSLGDSFQVTGKMLLPDGTYLEGGYSPSVVANDPVILTYNVACTSDLGGTYDFVLVSGDNGELASIPNQTIFEVAPGYYEISEVTMDIFAGGAPPVKYRFTDICGTLIPDRESVDFGTQVVVKFNAGTMVDEATGEITFHVEYISPSCCGLAGIKTVFKATPR